jgi:hypothetical protein
LSWTNPQTYSSVDVLRDDVLVATLPGTATTYSQIAAPGAYTYTVTGHCAAGGASATCDIVHAPYTAQSSLVFAGEAPYGDVDSVSTLAAALTAAGESVLIFDDLAFACFSQLPASGIVWICLGTFPANYVLTTAEGTVLANLAAGGTAIYIEGADHWGFDPPTPFAALDGVENDTSLDGDDSFVTMEGLNYSSLELAGFSADYDHDQAASDYTDRLLPTGATAGIALDLSGAGAGAVWADVDQGYFTAIFYAPAEPAGRVIAQSWEFGGYLGDAGELAHRYADALRGVGPGGEFQRGNVNTNLGTDVSDVVYLLNYLFVIGSPDLPCRDAADTNDSGLVDISDAVYLLNFLFVPGSPPPPSPGPTQCGADPTPDAQDCASFPSCL